MSIMAVILLTTGQSRIMFISLFELKVSMNRKAKGTSAERELIHKFWTAGWAAVRVAGSGSMRYPSPDIIAATPVRRLALECKASGDGYQYLDQEDVSQLRLFSLKFAAEPWFAVRFDGEGWYFVSLEDLESSGKAYSISIMQAKSRGLLFDELLGKFQ